ncbi:MAG: hypothetical protein ACYS67_04500, partial [Planctomycetota bacterium]
MRACVDERNVKVNMRRIWLLALFFYSTACLFCGCQQAEVKPKVVKEEKERFIYPVNIRPAGEVALSMEAGKTADGEDVMTVIGRFYIWQKQEEVGDLLELQADNAVIWYLKGPESG